jgi:hypothetical protein
MVSTDDEITSEERRMMGGDAVSTPRSESNVVSRVICRRMSSALSEMGVLDLVCYAASHFFPSALLLRAEKFRGVFEHEDVAEMLAVVRRTVFEQADGRGEMQDAGAGLHLHLCGRGSHAMGAAKQMLERVDDLGWQHRGQCEADEFALAAGVQHLGEGAVGENDVTVRGERHHPGWDGLDDGFELRAPCLQGKVDL